MKKFLAVLLLTGFILPGFAQDSADAGNRKTDGSRIEALKIAYLTKKMELSTEEAQRFWPVYNKYSAEIRQTRMDQRRNKTPELEREEKLLQLRKKYNIEFSKVLGSAKSNSFFRAEKEFGSYVQKELTERRKMRQSQPGQHQNPRNR